MSKPRDDDEHESKLDRELIELMNELRVALPGVQVMFAFLLAVPFSQRFEQLDDSQRGVYFLAVLASAFASIFLIAPSTHHRIVWRQFDKERLLRRANRLTLMGAVCLAVAIVAVVYLIGDVLYGRETAIPAAAVAGTTIWTWFGYPLVLRATSPRPGDD
jgi:hypothetical protein